MASSTSDLQSLQIIEDTSYQLVLSRGRFHQNPMAIARGLANLAFVIALVGGWWQWQGQALWQEFLQEYGSTLTELSTQSDFRRLVGILGLGIVGTIALMSLGLLRPVAQKWVFDRMAREMVHTALYRFGTRVQHYSLSEIVAVELKQHQGGEDGNSIAYELLVHYQANRLQKLSLGRTVASASRRQQAIARKHYRDIARKICVFLPSGDTTSLIDRAVGDDTIPPEINLSFKGIFQEGKMLFETARLSQKQGAAAIAQLEAAVQANPTDPHTHKKLGIALLTQKRRAEAKACLQQALELFQAQGNESQVALMELLLLNLNERLWPDHH